MKWSELWQTYGFRILSAAIILLVLIVSISLAKAAGTSATITWTHPVTYIDGSPLALADIKETVITWRRPGASAVVGSVVVAAPATTTVVNGLICGNFNFTAATVVQTASSAETAPVIYATGLTCNPNPPTGLKAT